MDTARYNLHRDVLGIPSYLGAMLVGLALGNWFVGLVLMIAALVPYHRIYRAYFSEAPSHPRRSDVLTNLLFVVAQLTLWGIAFFAANVLRKAYAAI
jgi:hypothetical protein